MLVLDSDILIDNLNGRRDAILALSKIQDGEVSTTTVNAFEVLFGAFNSGIQSRVDSVRRLISELKIMDFDLHAAEKTALLQAVLKNKGMLLDSRDAMIAGIVLSRGATLVTRNLKHFNRVPGLKVVKW